MYVIGEAAYFSSINMQSYDYTESTCMVITLKLCYEL